MMVPPRAMTEKWAAVGSTLASLMFILAMIRQYCPEELRNLFNKSFQKVVTFFNPYMNIYIHEFTSTSLKRNEAFVAAEAYLSSNSSKDVRNFKAEMAKNSESMVLSIEDHEKVTDEFKGVRVSWMSRKDPSTSSRSVPAYQEQEKKSYRLTFHSKDRDLIAGAYLEHVAREGREIISRNRRRKLYTNVPLDRFLGSRQTTWSHIAFEHPATFETMAMDPGKKMEIMEDLKTFTKSKDFYARIGKAWKRGYLLYGPPGTGKSTMIAAMANLLNYDLYDLELTAVKDNTELRKLLIETTSKSVTVVEDIDCSLDLTGTRSKTKTNKTTMDEEKESGLEHEIQGNDKETEKSESKITLSGLLNFIDGLWSVSGGERIIVFTTNHVEKLDPALIRRGRMDKHIELSYCTFEGFKVFAKNYLEMETHPEFDRIKRLIEQVEISPADVAESLMPKSASEDAEKCLMNLVRALEEKANPEAAKTEADIAEAKANKIQNKKKDDEFEEI